MFGQNFVELYRAPKSELQAYKDDILSSSSFLYNLNYILTRAVQYHLKFAYHDTLVRVS